MTYNNNVKGPVESLAELDPVTRKFVVLGQSVIANSVTYFKDTAFDAAGQNDVVEVSGYLDDTGTIWATFIGKTGEAAPDLEVEVTGYTVNLDETLESFEINGLTVDYSLTDTSDLPHGQPTNGQFVEVEGLLDATGAGVVASTIRVGDGLSVGNAGEIEITGFVTEFVSLSEFTVGNQPVQTGADTLFVDGTQADGTLVGGILFAKEIEFWDPNQIEVEGVVTDIESLSAFTVGSQRVAIDSDTLFEGGVLEEVALGVKLEVKGAPVDAARSVLLADKVSFERP